MEILSTILSPQVKDRTTAPYFRGLGCLGLWFCVCDLQTVSTGKARGVRRDIPTTFIPCASLSVAFDGLSSFWGVGWHSEGSCLF